MLIQRNGVNMMRPNLADTNPAIAQVATLHEEVRPLSRMYLESSAMSMARSNLALENPNIAQAAQLSAVQKIVAECKKHCIFIDFDDFSEEEVLAFDAQTIRKRFGLSTDKAEKIAAIISSVQISRP